MIRAPFRLPSPSEREQLMYRIVHRADLSRKISEMRELDSQISARKSLKATLHKDKQQLLRTGRSKHRLSNRFEI